MSFSFKKAAAIAAAVCCTVSLCGCADSGYIGSVDGVQIRNGVYLSGIMTAYGDANTEITEAKAEVDDTSEVSDVFAETIDGQDANEWIKQETLNYIKRFVAIQRLFEEYGFTLTTEEIQSVNDDANALWNESNMYAQYIYGTDTMGEYYESVGIGKDSIKEVYTNSTREEYVFDHNYEKDGTTPVTDEEFDSYIKENYANVKYIQVPYQDYKGLNLDTDEEKQAVKDKAQGYIDRLNGGTAWIDVQYDFDLETARNEARATAEDEYTENPTAEAGTTEATEEQVDYDTYVQNAVDAVTVEKKETAEECETIISKESSSLDEGLTEFVWNAADDGKATMYETDTAVYVVVRDDITTKEEWKENNRSTVLHAIKDEDFEQLLKDTYANYDVSLDSYLVDTKYAPNKVKGLS